MIATHRTWLLAALLAAGCDQCGGGEAETPIEDPEATTEAETDDAPEPLSPLPEVDVNMEKVFLGRRLFHDPVLSGDGSVSCATCHSLDHGGAEARRTSTGIGGQTGPINSPTVLNAHFNFRQFWDGRAADLKEQAAGPVENPAEMGGAFADVVPRIEADEWYAERFAAVYGDDAPVSKENITDAIAEYESYLITPSPFDAYLAGNEDAIPEQARRGYETFKGVGCTACHQGTNVGGGMYQKMGVVQSYFELRGGELTEADLGRFNLTGDESDRHYFKVPTLRNVAQTAPYFHDGSQTELASAVRIMGKVQLGRDLSDEQVGDIVAFLETLSGDLPEHARLPESDAIPPRATVDATDDTGVPHEVITDEPGGDEG